MYPTAVGIVNAFSSRGAGDGLQEPGVGISFDASGLEHQQCPARVPRRELAAQRVSGVLMVEGTAIMESDLAQLGMVRSGAR